MAVTLPGCIITQPVHFDEPPNSPPAITSAAGALVPIDAVVQYPSVFSMGTADAGMPQSLPLDVVIYDPDVTQALHYAALLDRSLVPCTGCNGDLAPSTALTGRERRSLTVQIPIAALSPNVPQCHRITLVVTGQFSAGTAMPLDPIGDAATATWWVAVSPNGETVDMRSCP